jgi:hypothetical protein
MTKTHRTVWRTATTNRDLLEYDAQRHIISVPVLEVSRTELAELHEATAQLLLELAEKPITRLPAGGAQ